MGWTIEERFLFKIIRERLLTGSPEERGALSDPSEADMGQIDWIRFLDCAIEGGVAPIAYVSLADAGRIVPDHVLERLRMMHRLSAVENMQYFEYARRLFSGCADRGIDVIALRGLTFAGSLYPDPSLRPVSDIDLLVRPEAMASLEILLAAQGYAQIPAHPQQWTNQTVVVDVHTDLIGGERIASRHRAMRIDMAAVWGASAPAVVAGAPARILCQVDTILTCGLHALKHSCDRMLWFVDLAVLLQTPHRVSWDDVVARARQFGLERPAYYAFLYLMRTMGASIPEHAMQALRPARAGWMEKRLMNRLLRGNRPGRFGEVFTLLMMERSLDRWRFIKETCFPGKNVLEQSYGVSDHWGWSKRIKRIWHVADLAFGVISGGGRSRKAEG